MSDQAIVHRGEAVRIDGLGFDPVVSDLQAAGPTPDDPAEEGAEGVAEEAPDEEIAALPEHSRPLVYWASGFLYGAQTFEGLMDHPDDAVHRVRLSFYALITTDEEWTRFEERFGVRLVEGYGLSETLGICTCNPAVFGKVKRHCIGLPVPGREIRVIDEEGIDQPSGKPGRIMVRGHPMFSGYFKNPEATTACMVEGWFDTGDNGFFDEDGYLHFFDRSKDVIKSGGEWISSIDIENIAMAHPDVAMAACIGMAHPKWDERPVVCVVKKPGSHLTAADLLKFYEGKTAKWQIPDDAIFVEAIPLGATGKMLKTKLREQLSGYKLPSV